ncbi:unnamed protein product, partial [Staurois parvus]
SYQGRTDNSWGPRANRGSWGPVSSPKLKKAYEKGTRGISWGPLLTPGSRAVPEFPNGQSAPGSYKYMALRSIYPVTNLKKAIKLQKNQLFKQITFSIFL